MTTAWRPARPPPALISPATFSPAATSVSRMPTAQPSSPSRRAIAAPMPLLPPVTMTVRSFSPRIFPPTLRRSLAGPRQHAGGLVGHHHLVELVLHVDLRHDDPAVAFRCWPHRRHLDLAVHGVADAHRRQHLLPEFEHRQPGPLDHALADQTLDQAVGERRRREPPLDRALPGAERVVGED